LVWEFRPNRELEMRTWVGLALVGCAGTGGVDPAVVDDTDDANEQCVTGLKVGQCPPEFSLPDAVGEPVALSTYIGRPVAVVGSSLW
jgi:hypothetical protein